MLDNVSTKLNRVLKFLKGEAKITEDNMKQALREIKLSLLEADVNFKVVKSFIANISQKAMGEEVQQSLTPYQQVLKIVRSELQTLLGGESREVFQGTKKPAVIMLVGLQGTGKTTTAGKLGHYLKEQGKSVLMCSLDLKRLAAGEQLETIATEVGAGFFKNPTGKLKKLCSALIKEAKDYGYDYIIADTAGRLHVDDSLMEELKSLEGYLNPAEIFFVADALTGQDAVNSALNFSKAVSVSSIILTKMDADSRGGAALSMVSVTGKPISFIGVGEKHRDFQRFHPDRLASQILGMGDMLSLIEKAEKEFDEKQAEKVARRMMRNEFTLDDFRLQLQQVQKLGSMNDIMGMMPNMGGLQARLGQAEVDEKQISHMVAIINSMTVKEREKPKIINGRRRLRISRGSGRSVQEVNRLLKSYQDLKNYMKKPFFRKLMKKFDISGKMM